MNYQITTHALPWEIDLLQLMAIQLKKSKYYLDLNKDSIEIRMVLNLSNYLIDWNQSKLPKEFFKKKFESLAPLLKDYTFKLEIYEGNNLYGCLDAVRESVKSHIDFYINISPDIYFTEHLLYYMIESSKQIKNKYFVLIPEISKMWDETWDEITNQNYLSISNEGWGDIDIFDIRYQLKNNSDEVKLAKVNKSKFAGWCDLYNKAFYEELAPVRSDFNGYGGWDFYAMIVADTAKRKGYDYQQWILKNQIAFEYSIGPLKDIGFTKYYKELIIMNQVPNQRDEWNKNFNKYLSDKINTL